ncbi:MAG: S9 family peptidase, partial [Sphingobacterium sp.]
MMKYLGLGILAISLVACQQENKIESKTDMIVKPYPQTKKGEQKDDFFGTVVDDPYRWLEDDLSAETKDWVKAENEVTEDYLGQIPFRENISKRLEHLWN